jgi:hypothetical protein
VISVSGPPKVFGNVRVYWLWLSVFQAGIPDGKLEGLFAMDGDSLKTETVFFEGLTVRMRR